MATFKTFDFFLMWKVCVQDEQFLIAVHWRHDTIAAIILLLNACIWIFDVFFETGVFQIDLD